MMVVEGRSKRELNFALNEARQVELRTTGDEPSDDHIFEEGYLTRVGGGCKKRCRHVSLLSLVKKYRLRAAHVSLLPSHELERM